MIKIQSGSTRVAVILFNWIVLKFPKWRYMSKKRTAKQYVRGLLANLTEFYTYLVTHKPTFLVPVFSLIFVNIQFYEDGEVPSEDEIRLAVHSKLSDRAKGMLMFVDGHCLNNKNWRKDKRGGVPAH